MPRIIKDGAYTIIIDDTPPASQGAPNATDGDGIGTVGETSEGGTIGTFFESVKVEPAEAEEEIDYSSTSFILQNLQIALPVYSEDKTHLMVGRRDLIEIICCQTCFYIYAALHALDIKQMPFSILIIGDGHLGSVLATKLMNFGMGLNLRIFSRGDTSLEEWQAKGIRADNQMLPLLNGQRPDIIIPCTENSSFATVCRQLLEYNLIIDSTFIISPTLGFQRRKLYNNLKCPAIFRTFCEPHTATRRYKSKSAAFSSNLAIVKALIACGDAQSDEDDEVGGEVKKVKDSPSKAGSIDLSSIMGGGQSINSDPSLGVGYLFEDTDDEANYRQGAAWMAQRYKDMKNFLFLLEHFYSVQQMSPLQARKTAVKVIFDFVDAEDRRVLDEIVHREASRNNSVQLSAHWSEELSASVHMSASGSVHSESTAIGGDYARHRHFMFRDASKVHNYKVRHALHRCIEAMHDSLATYFQQQFSKYVTHDILDDLANLREHAVHATTPKGGHRTESYVDKSGKHHFVRHEKHVQGLYDERFLVHLFSLDDEYDNMSGPGFSYMFKLDHMGRGTEGLSKPNTAESAVALTSKLSEEHLDTSLIKEGFEKYGMGRADSPL